MGETNAKVNGEGWPKAHYSHAWVGVDHEVGLDLYVKLDRPMTEDDKRRIGIAMRALQEELLAETERLDPRNAEAKKTWLREAREMFKRAEFELIYMKEIPNEYCNRSCCFHRVWLLVTTKVGVIKVGWRKRVLVIDWSASDVLEMAEDLFAKEETTKDGQMIHAWGYEKGEEYLRRIREAGVGAPGASL